MNITEFYEAFQDAAPKFEWRFINRYGKDVLRAYLHCSEICPITSTYYDMTGMFLDVWNVREAGEKLGLSYHDVGVVMCAADNDILKDISVEERDRCRTRLLQIMGLTSPIERPTGVSDEIDPATESNDGSSDPGK